MRFLTASPRLAAHHGRHHPPAVPIVILTPAISTDIEELCSLVNAAYRGQGRQPGWTHETGLIEGRRADPASLAAMLEQEATVLLWRTSTDDKLIGCVAVQPQDGSTTWYISMLAIAPEQQAAGLGRILLNAAESYAAERGATAARMTVIQLREPLIAWYERRGYKRTGETESFPYEDPSVGKPLRADLHFVVLEKAL
jgi:ribosomal protein S18 acetylase RimI-like enzyme